MCSSAWSLSDKGNFACAVGTWGGRYAPACFCSLTLPFVSAPRLGAGSCNLRLCWFPTGRMSSGGWLAEVIRAGGSGCMAPVRSCGPPAAPRAPTVIRVGVYLLNVGKLDIGAGTYAMDLYCLVSLRQRLQPRQLRHLNGRVTAENDDDPRLRSIACAVS